MNTVTRRVVHSYKADAQERLNIGFLANASASDVVRWLEANWEKPVESNDSWIGMYTLPSIIKHNPAFEGRKLLEYILCRRNDPSINWAIARYGHCTKAVQKEFDRGNVGTKIAALMNPRGSIWLKQYKNILQEGKVPYVKALLQNPYLPSDFLEDLLARKKDFANITDDRFFVIIEALTGNKRLIRPYDDLILNGLSEYSYNNVTIAAWELTKTAPVSRLWAGALWYFLVTCQRPYKFDGLEETLERWRIDKNPNEESSQWDILCSLRSLIAGFLDANEALLNAEDLALRISFYERFDPRSFPQWPDFLQKDGDNFVWAALDNKNLWSSDQERQRLRSTCWAVPDVDMTLPNRFRVFERKYQKANPK